MAQTPLEKLEEQLNCSICLDTYIDPKLLQCHHIYCRKCLVKLVYRDDQGKLVLDCPACRQITPIPANGVSGLMPAFHVNHLLDIQDSFKKMKDSSFAETPSPGAASKSLGTVIKYCFDHGEELKLYCETCGDLICFHCIMKGSKHHSHDYELFDKAFERYKVEISSSLEPMENQLKVVNKALARLDARCAELSDQRAVIEADIHNTIRRLHEELEVRKTFLINQLHQITQGKLKGLGVQRDQIETTQAQLNSCLEFMRESLRKGKERGEVLLMKKRILKQVNELTTSFQLDLLKPNTEADIVFSVSAEVSTKCQNYGKVSAPGLPDPSKCHIASTDRLGAAMVGEKSTAVLQAISYNGQPCEVPIKLSECELVSEITGIRARGSVERKGQSQYEISYQPTVKGRHQLYVQVEGQHIRGSPFNIVAKSPVQNLGTPVLTIGRVVEPWGVAINQRGEVVVADYDGHCISVFSPSGKKLRSFGTRGSAAGEMVYPRGVTVDGEQNILVVDDVQGIQKYTSSGAFVTSTLNTQCANLADILDIAYNPSNGKIYAASMNNCVHILNSDLTISHTFGKQDGSERQFSVFCGIACDSTGKVYVADSGNHRIQVFTARGRLLRVFGRRGNAQGELGGPIGVSIDTQGLVYVSEKDNHRVSVFTSEGQFVTSFGRKGKGAGQFNEPLRLAVDLGGVVYVCDRFNKRVQVF